MSDEVVKELMMEDLGSFIEEAKWKIIRKKGEKYEISR